MNYENCHSGKVARLFAEWSKNYDEYDQNSLSYILAKKLLSPELYKIKDSDWVLDLGCGSGETIRPILQYTKNICGVDLTPEMVTLAKNKFPELDLRVCDIEKGLPFEDSRFNVVVSSLVFQFVKDLNKVCGDVYRVLVGGGEFLYTTHVSDGDLDWKDVKYKKDKIFKGSVGSVSTFYPTDFHRDVLTRCGFSNIEVIKACVTENDGDILTENSFNNIKGKWSLVMIKASKNI